MMLELLSQLLATRAVTPSSNTYDDTAPGDSLCIHAGQYEGNNTTHAEEQRSHMHTSCTCKDTDTDADTDADTVADTDTILQQAVT